MDKDIDMNMDMNVNMDMNTNMNVNMDMNMDINVNMDMNTNMDIDLDVIARVAAKTALGERGVLALENAFTDGIAAALAKDGRTRGVRVASEADGYGFHIGVVTKYGENIPEIAWNLQDHIKKTVEHIIGVKVKRVDVLIAGIREEG